MIDRELHRSIRITERVALLSAEREAQNMNANGVAGLVGILIDAA
jgi:hypothetical protein